MKLTDEQKAAVAAWFAGGASLDEIQKRIAAEFGVHVTYLDLRLFVADLPQPKEVVEDAEAGVPSADGGGVGTRRPTNGDAEDAGSVTVSLDPITPAGVMAAGGVTFSDGTSGKWYLDRYGRLGLSGVPEGYRPSPEDGALFQSRLVELLQSKGLM